MIFHFIETLYAITGILFYVNATALIWKLMTKSQLKRIAVQRGGSMSKFRFKPEDFSGLPNPVMVPLDKEEKIFLAKHCNALLEAEEAKCERVFADCCPVRRDWGDEAEYPESVRGKFTITALLWSVENI